MDRRSRGNGGGEVDAAMGAAGCFTGSGVLAYLKDSTGAYGAYGSNDDARTLSPVIVLTDGETASASELFASDIRDTNTGILVGGRTFGKGVAQTVLDQRALPDYFPDGDAIKITSYRFYALRLHHRHRWPDPPPAGGPRSGPRGRHPSLRLQPQGLHGELSAYRLQLALVCGAGHRPE
ncbi:MAG: S41 family peptidase [Flavonifractor plautii]